MQAATTQIPRHAVQKEAARVDLYTGIHKAMRALLCDTLAALGRMDTGDAAEVGSTLARVRHAVHLSRHHLYKENQYLHPAMESRRRGSTALVRGQHAEHEEAFERLETLALRVERSEGAARDAAALELYRQFALFMAHDFVHTHAEETENNAVLWEHFTDEELHAIHGTILKAVGPQLMAEYLRWMVPAMTPAERAGLLVGARATLPPEEFAGVLAMVRSVLAERDWNKVLGALGPRPLGV